MRNYNFNEKITWQEFEELSCEVVQRRENLQIQTFKRASDEGKDGFWFDEYGNLVLQVKHYKNFKSLYAKLENEELDKVRKLNPDRYILVVSLELQPKQAGQIYTLFGDYIKESKDLITAKELNNFLAQPMYRDIEMQHKNLWLADYELMVEILKELLGIDTKKRTPFEHEKVLQVAKTFVPTQKYEQALAQMERNHTVIVSGEPGMGKTTIARMLAFEYLGMQGMDGYVWADKLEDIETKWNDNQKQVFILDDFWGSIFHNENRRKMSRKLEDFIYRIKEEENKRLIITSREYIVQQEICKSPELEDVIHHLKLECVLKDYSKAERAKILFSHLENSDLEYEYIKHIFWSCDRIVYHRGYSPRIIDKFINLNHSLDYSPEDYVDELLDYLEYPENFWKEICKELSEEAKIVAMIMAISYTPIQVDDIKRTYGRYIQLYSNGTAIKSFDLCISELEKTFITTYWDEETDDLRVVFENPSIAEFFYMYIQENYEYYVPILCRISIFYNQLLSLVDHFTYHDESVRSGVETRCLEEFYELPMRLQDYADVDFGERFEAGSDWAGRAFSLLAVSRTGDYPQIKRFIRNFVDEFFQNVQDNPLFDGVEEFINFVGIVRVAEERGIHFDGRALMQQYLLHCSWATDFDHFESFREIYPDIYRDMEPMYVAFMKKNIKNIILETLDYFYEFDFDFQLDLLVDNIPVILRKYNLRYTDKYKQQIKKIAGRYYEASTYNRMFIDDDEEEVSKEEEDYEQVKQEGLTRLLGEEPEILEDEEVVEAIKKQAFPTQVEESLLQVMEEYNPWYVVEMLRQEQNILLLRDIIDKWGLEKISLDATLFMMMILYHLTEGKSDSIRGILFFCTAFVEEFGYKEDAILTAKTFADLPAYKEYIEGNDVLEEILFTYIFVQNSKWVEVANEALLLFCYCYTLVKTQDFDWELPQDDGFPKVLRKKNTGEKHIYYAEYGAYVNYDWKCKMLKWFQELDKESFYVNYVFPQIQSFLEELEGKEDPVLFLLQKLRCVIEVNEEHEVVGEEGTVLDAIELLEILEITDCATLIGVYLTEEEIISLKGRKSICKKKEENVLISLYKEKNVSFLKKCGIYRILNQFLDEVRKFVSVKDNC